MSAGATKRIGRRSTLIHADFGMRCGRVRLLVGLASFSTEVRNWMKVALEESLDHLADVPMPARGKDSLQWADSISSGKSFVTGELSDFAGEAPDWPQINADTRGFRNEMWAGPAMGGLAVFY